MGTSYGQPFVGVEARNAVYIRKDKNSPPKYRLGQWSYEPAVDRSLFSTNPFLNNSNSFSFCITLKRLTANNDNFGGISYLGYHTAQADNFYFGIQKAELGSTIITLHLRLNDYSGLLQTNIANNSTFKVLATYNGTTGYFWTNKTSPAASANVTRPINNRPSLSQLINTSDFEITNVAWWTRVLTASEKDSYFDGTMSIFQ